MRILQIEARDIVMTMELSLSDMEKIKIALDHAELTVSEDPTDRVEVKEACNFLTMEFYPFINKSIEGIKEGR